MAQRTQSGRGCRRFDKLAPMRALRYEQLEDRRMLATGNLLDNPGAEDGTLLGWRVDWDFSGSKVTKAASGLGPTDGDHFFFWQHPPGGREAWPGMVFFNKVDVSAHAVEIDEGGVAATGGGDFFFDFPNMDVETGLCCGSTNAQFAMRFFLEGDVVSQVSSEWVLPYWHGKMQDGVSDFRFTADIPVGTRAIEFGAYAVSSPAENEGFFAAIGFDDLFLEISVDLPPPAHHAWLVHGFKPPHKGWDSFRAEYKPGGSYHDRTEEALASNPDTTFEVSDLAWDSSTGWNEAFGYLFLKAEMGSPPPAMFSAISYFVDDKIERGLGTGRLLSNKASSVLENQIRSAVSSNHVAGSEGTTITLIGHSRGGELVARAMNALRPELDRFEVKTQAILLDAYGTDWPGISGILGTDQPFPAGRGNDYNVLVEKGLAEAGMSRFGIDEPFISGVLRGALGKLAGVLVPPELPLDREVFQRTWKAPERPQMKNRLLPESDHLSVTDYFFLRQDLPAWFDGAYTSGAGEGLDYENIPLVRAVAGGSAEDLTFRFDTFTSETAGIQDVPSYLAPFVDALKTPDAWVRSVWETSGSVELNTIDQLIELVGDGSSIGQVVSLPPGDTNVRIVGAQISGSSQASDRVELYFDGKLVGQVDGIALNSGPELNFVISNTSTTSAVGIIELRYKTQRPESVLSVSTLELALNTPVVEVHVVSDSGAPNLEFRFPENDHERVTGFYLESNAIPGLQRGDGGDIQLTAYTEGDVLVAGIPGLDASPRYVMMSYELSDGQHIYTELSIRNDYQTNIAMPLDTSLDGVVSPQDVLLVINFLNASYAMEQPSFTDAPLDVSMDKFVSPLDALIIINFLNRQGGNGGEAEPEDVDSRFDELYGFPFESLLEREKERHGLADLWFAGFA